MKCAVCGKEFGTGNTCQHCGSDKFTGLGNYSGYNPPIGNENIPIQTEEIDSQSTNYMLQTENVGVIACYACGEIIPADSKFCPYCSKRLYVTCPKCGHKYSSQFPACNQCGTNRIKFIEIDKMKKDGKLFEIPSGTVSLYSYEFINADFNYIIIPTTVVSIDDHAFQDCKLLKKIVIPDSVTTIGKGAFWGCKSLEEIVLSNSISSISDYTFYGCDKLNMIHIPSYVNRIGDKAFLGCHSLKEIKLPDSIISLGSESFLLCSSLEKIILPKSLESVGHRAFGGDYNLTAYCKREIRSMEKKFKIELM